MKLLLADRHRLAIEGLRAVLETAGDIEVVGETHRGSQLLQLVNRLKPDAVLLDLSMSEIDGPTCLDLLRERFPAVKVIALGPGSDPRSVEDALARGAQGYIVETIDLDDLAQAIRGATDGSAYHTFGLAAPDPTVSGAELEVLTDREIVVLRAVARGLSNRAIGEELWVTEQTVKFHLTNIYRKLNVANRTEAALKAFDVVDRSAVDTPDSR